MPPENQVETAELARETRSSIELKRDAKAVYSWAIKLYFDADDRDDAAAATSQLRTLDRTLRSMFNPDPLPY